jgi:hypothetical protein
VLIIEGSRVRGFSGCNTFTGTYKVEKDRFQFLQMASTGKACQVGMELEQRFLSALNDAVQFKISGDTLSLYNADGQSILRFDEFFGSLYHLNTQEEAEQRDYQRFAKSYSGNLADYEKKFGTRVVMHSLKGIRLLVTKGCQIFQSRQKRIVCAPPT